jgi:hypothetical protein
MTRSFVAYSSIFLACLSVACGYDNGDRIRKGTDIQPIVVSGSIDTGKTMTNTDSGVGAFVEYATGGNWTLRVGCDTATSDKDCMWHIYAYTTVGVPILSSQAIDLETSDVLSVKSDGELWLDTVTTVDLDGVSFVTEPGEPITFDLQLEGDKYPERYFYYISNGEVVEGVASPVIELTPTEA